MVLFVIFFLFGYVELHRRVRRGGGVSGSGNGRFAWRDDFWGALSPMRCFSRGMAADEGRGRDRGQKKCQCQCQCQSLTQVLLLSLVPDTCP